MSIERGSLLYRTGRYELAEQEFRAALGAEPTNALGHAMLGLCLLQRNQYADATYEAEQAIHLRPDWHVGYATLASVLLARRHLKEAATAALAAVRLDPFDPDHRGLLANVRLQQRRWADALASADAGLAVDPAHAACVNARGQALVNLGRRDEAALTLGGQLARDPLSAVTHANQGWTLLHAGEYRGALEHFRESLRIDPNQQWAKAGIVEALKARNPVYRVMLRYFLFMSRMSRQVQWAILIGGYVGQQLLSQLSASHPAVRPYVLPVMGLYVTFAVMTWLAGPAFNLLLRVDRFGRYALSREQRWASNGFALCLLASLALVVTWAVTRDQNDLLAALVPAVLSMPLTSAFGMSRGWPRWTMAGVTAALAALGGVLVALLLHGAGGYVPTGTNGVAETYFYGVLGSQFLSNYLAGVRPRR